MPHYFKRQEYEAARKARRQYKRSPTPFRNIKSTILAHLTEMEIPDRERAELEQDHAIREYLIEQLDDTDSLISQGPTRGDTRQGIIEAVQEKCPGTPEFPIEKALELLAQDGNVFRDGAASLELRDEVWRVGPELADASMDDDGAEQRPGTPTNETTHSMDFTSVNWFGKRYKFTIGQQADTVKALWAAWDAGGHSLAQETIGHQIGSASNCFQLSKVFRRTKPGGGYEFHPAWNTMIQSESKGNYRLVPPNSA